MDKLLLIYNSIKPYKYPIHPKILARTNNDVYEYYTLQIFSQIDPDMQFQNYRLLEFILSDITGSPKSPKQLYSQLPFYIDFYQSNILYFFHEIAIHVTIYQLIDLMTYLRHHVNTPTDNITILHNAINYAKIKIPELKVPETDQNITLPPLTKEELDICKIIFYSNTENQVSYNLSKLDVTLLKSTIQKMPYHKFKQINPFSFKYTTNQITPRIQSFLADLKISDQQHQTIFTMPEEKLIVKKLRTLQELYNYQITDHPNINKLHAYTTTEQHQFLIFQDKNQKNLHDFLNSTKLTQAQQFHLINQLVQVILDLHTNNFYHADLKEYNIIIYPDLTLKLIDLEKAANQLDLRFTTAFIHLDQYLPPEAYPNVIYRYNHRMDTIPLVIIITRILTNISYQTIKEFLQNAHLHLPQPLLDMLLDPEKLTIHDIITHWFAEK